MSETMREWMREEIAYCARMAQGATEMENKREMEFFRGKMSVLKLQLQIFGNANDVEFASNF